jgi:hypothetical protein
MFRRYRMGRARVLVPEDTTGESRIWTLATRGEPVAFAALRIVLGLMLTFRGMQKIFGWHADAKVYS